MLKHAGSHNLTIDGNRFRYVVSEAGSGVDGRVRLSLIVQHAAANGCRLRIAGLFGERVPEQRSKFYRGRTLRRPVTPRDVEQWVRAATSNGWRPDAPGKDFVLRVGGDSAAE